MSESTDHNAFTLVLSPPQHARSPSGTIISCGPVIHGAWWLCRAAAAVRKYAVPALRRRWQRARGARPGTCCGGGLAAAKRAAFTAALATLHRGGNEEASSGGLVCGLQRRVYQVESHGVHSHRSDLRYAWGHAPNGGRRIRALTGLSPRRQPHSIVPVLQDQPPCRRCCAARSHDVPRVVWYGTG